MKPQGYAHRWLIPTAVAVLFSVTGTARASVLYTNLNANPLSKYDCCNAWIIEGVSSTYFAQGFSFIPSANEGLSQVDIALEAETSLDSVVVTLNADNSGLPGAVLETWNNITGLPAFGTCCTLQTLLPGVPLALSSGTVYWLVAFPAADATDAGWNQNNTGALGPRPVQSSPGGDFTLFGQSDPQGAFDVIGDGVAAVPEPASIVFAAAGLALLSARRRRRL